jgi:hypothetical protein
MEIIEKESAQERIIRELCKTIKQRRIRAHQIRKNLKKTIKGQENYYILQCDYSDDSPYNYVRYD